MNSKKELTRNNWFLHSIVHTWKKLRTEIKVESLGGKYFAGVVSIIVAIHCEQRFSTPVPFEFILASAAPGTQLATNNWATSSARLQLSLGTTPSYTNAPTGTIQPPSVQSLDDMIADFCHWCDHWVGSDDCNRIFCIIGGFGSHQ